LMEGQKQTGRPPEMLQRQETWSALADWAFAEGCNMSNQGLGSSSDGAPSLHSQERPPSLSDSVSASFSVLPVDELLPEPGCELPRDWPSSLRSIDPCKLAALSPEEEAEVCSRLQVDVPEPALAPQPRAATEPEWGKERKRARDEATTAQENQPHALNRTPAGAALNPPTMGTATAGEGAVRRELMAMNVHMQMEAQVRLYRLLLAHRQLQQCRPQQGHGGLAPTLAYGRSLRISRQ